MTARILIVDDLTTNVKLLEAKLLGEYYEVDSAFNGLEALEKLENDSSFDVILLDVMMPELDGFETCKRLKSNPKFAHIPVVMVTALSDTEDRIKGLACGADDFLTKPINDLALFARIRSLVRLKLMTDELITRDKAAEDYGMETSGFKPITDVVRNSKIALIEDDKSQATRIKEKIDAIGGKLVILDDPEVVFESILEGNFDLIIVSTQLTDMDGLRLCTQIKSNTQLRHLPVLIMVDEQEAQLVIKALDLGVNDYIIAPIDENELVARINTQVRKKKYQDALKDSYQKNVSLASKDKLTGLYNRHYFDTHFKMLFEKSMQEQSGLSILLIDIDFFKQVNDVHGHLAGDAILRQVPARIQQNLRETDLVARFGGEEFVVLFPNTDLRSAYLIADRVRLSVQEKSFLIPVEGNEEKLSKTISVGVTTLEPGDTPESLLDRADKALYKAKEQGRNKVVWMA